MTVDAAPTPRTPRAQRLPTSRPLLVRKDARFDCFGDGLCCTDIHALGPVTRAEKAALDLISPGSLVRSKDLSAPVFRTQDNGACVLRSERGCELHAVHGAEAKPTGCIRFPFNLVATPDGGRITTEHRCPCRTLGDRPLLTPEAAESSLRDPAGRLSANGRIGPRVKLEAGKRVPFHRYVEIESELIRDLLLLKDPFAVLRTRPFGKLRGDSWAEIAEKATSERDGTAYGVALAWFGGAIQRCAGQKRKLDLTERPWAKAYDRAEARPGKRSASDVLADYLADQLWSLDWAFSVGSFAAGKSELATLYAIALQITDSLIRIGTRPDRAAAEALTVVELSRQSEVWEAVQKGL